MDDGGRKRPSHGPADDDIFGEFEEEFERMRRRINRLMEEATRHDPDEGLRRIVYGISMRHGPGGRPMLEGFGNAPEGAGAHAPGEREPLVDVIDGQDEVTVIAELPGVEKEEIDLDVEGRRLTIMVDTDERRYYKALRMPAEVDPDTIRAQYKNGILEVKLKRLRRKTPAKKRIDVE
jgi:HSP20 family protein